MLENRQGRAPHLLGLCFQVTILLEPAGFIMIALAPDGLDYAGMYYLSAAALLVCYVGSRFLVQSPFGRILISVRENELRSAGIP